MMSATVRLPSLLAMLPSLRPPCPSTSNLRFARRAVTSLPGDETRHARRELLGAQGRDSEPVLVGDGVVEAVSVLLVGRSAIVAQTGLGERGEGVGQPACGSERLAG